MDCTVIKTCGQSKLSCDLVEKSKTKVVNGLLFPLWEGRLEGDCLGLEHTQRNGHKHSVSLEDAGTARLR